LRAAGYLKHVEVAVAVAGVEGFDGDGDQEIALSVVANALASRGVGYAFGLVEGVRYVIGKSGLVEDPLAIRRRGERRKRKSEESD
jgi:hypothetical protein